MENEEPEETETAQPKKKTAVKRAILVAEIGDKGYRVKRTTNFLDVRIGTMITREQATAYINDGINLTVIKNT